MFAKNSLSLMGMVYLKSVSCIFEVFSAKSAGGVEWDNFGCLGICVQIDHIVMSPSTEAVTVQKGKEWVLASLSAMSTTKITQGIL